MIPITTVKIILVFLPMWGLNQIKGKAKGPTHKKATIIQEVLKYHLACGLSGKSSPQCVHSAVLYQSSVAQYGHFFI